MQQLARKSKPVGPAVVAGLAGVLVALSSGLIAVSTELVVNGPGGAVRTESRTDWGGFLFVGYILLVAMVALAGAVTAYRGRFGVALPLMVAGAGLSLFTPAAPVSIPLLLIAAAWEWSGQRPRTPGVDRSS